MGIRAFFHKIKMWFVRAGKPSIPYVGEKKRYGNYGENKFVTALSHALIDCKIKRNVIASTPEGSAEIDCLVLYQNKLFAIEVKCWKGVIIECEDGFLTEKTDRWTGEKHRKRLKSPFKQLSRAVYLLKKQISINAWVNSIVFFEDDELESVSVFSDNVWFDSYSALANYIFDDGKASYGTGAVDFFERCTPADYLYARAWGRSLHCVIDRNYLCFEGPHGKITADQIASIHISHRWSCDDLNINLIDGNECLVTVENAEIIVYDDEYPSKYALCKLDYIELGRAHCL